MNYAILGAVAVITVISLVVGLVKGYSNTKTWASEYFFATLITILVCSLVDTENDFVYAFLALGLAIVLLLLFAWTSRGIRKFFNKKTAAARKRYYYESYGEREEHFLEIIDALELNDKRKYEKLTNRKMKEKSGGVGVANRLCGGLSLAFKSLVICTVTVAVVLLAMQLTQINFGLDDIYASGAWQFISPYILDFVLVGIIQFAIRAGYRAGIIRSLWTLLLIALVVFAGYVAYGLTFETSAFVNLSASWAQTDFFASIGEQVSAVFSSFSVQNICQILIMIILFIVQFILIIVFGSIIGGVLIRAREDKFLSTADGFVGAIVFTLLAIVILLLVGMVMYAFNEAEFMATFNSYCYTDSWSAAVFSSIYSHNPLNSIVGFQEIQQSIAGFFGLTFAN